MPARLFLCAAFCCALVSSAYAQRANRDRERESLAPQLLGRAGAVQDGEDEGKLPVLVLSPTERLNRARAVEALSRTITTELKDTPLDEVILKLSKEADIPIEIDRKALEEATIGTDTQITYRVQPCTLRQVLDAVARDHNLAWILRGPGIRVTTKEAMDSNPDYRDVVVYPVVDLVRFSGGDDYDSVIDLITTTIRPDSWRATGTGEGTIEPFPSSVSIVVSQSFEIHEQIVNLLESLRVAKAQQGAREWIRDEEVVASKPDLLPQPRVRHTRQRTRWGKSSRVVYHAPLVG